jgi:hypothetical protein
VRLACTNAIRGAVEGGRLRLGAGVDAIFPGSPFERRFRDMHTLSQQIRHAPPISKRSGGSCSAVPPRSFFLEHDPEK